MLYGKDRQARYDDLTEDWKNEVAIKQLDQILQLIEICQSASLIALIFLPISLMTVVRFQYLTSHNKMIGEFKGTIVWENWVVVLSSLSYAISLKYLLPILTHFWNFFHQTINLEKLGQNLWQFATVQAAIVLTLHLSFTALACRSFKILPTFNERYERLKKQRDAYEEVTLVEILLKARIMEQLPIILTTAISTQMNTILTALVLNEEQAQKLQETFPKALKSIVGSVMQQVQVPKTIEGQTEPEYDD